MSVFQREGSPFYYYRFMLEGRRYTGSTGETSPYKAKQAEADKIAALRRGEIPVTGKSPRLSAFAQVFKQYVREASEAGHLAVKTRKYYENGCRLLEGTRVWNLRLHQIKSDDAATLKFPHSPSNANNALRTLRSMLGYAKKRNVLRIVPVISLLEENERQAIMEPWIEDLILEFAPPKFRDAAILMLDTYMRPVEWTQLRWEDVRLDEHRIYIAKSKTRRGRRFVGMSDRVEQLLRERLAERESRRMEARLKGQEIDEPWVFPSRRAKSGHLMPGSIDKMWAQTKVRMLKAIAERNLPPLPADLVPYSARHTGLTNFNMATGDVAKTARIAGHADIRTTQKYLHPSTADHAEVVNRHNKQKARLAVVAKRA